eukprot:432116-Pleurochrysis_carterae.AAC.1
MRRRRFREQCIRVDLAISSPFSRLALLRCPALALRCCGNRIVVSSLPALGLDSVDVVAINLSRGDRIYVAREDGAVVIEWVRLAGVVPRVDVVPCVLG